MWNTPCFDSISLPLTEAHQQVSRKDPSGAFVSLQTDGQIGFQEMLIDRFFHSLCLYLRWEPWDLGLFARTAFRAVSHKASETTEL